MPRSVALVLAPFQQVADYAVSQLYQRRGIRRVRSGHAAQYAERVFDL
ncbi:MAG TPA: hypothetical protein VGA04_18115 [Streptosporangiaceae bacterium]